MPHVRSSNKRIRTTPTTNGPAFEETYMPTDPTVATTEPDINVTPKVGNPRTADDAPSLALTNDTGLQARTFDEVSGFTAPLTAHAIGPMRVEFTDAKGNPAPYSPGPAAIDDAPDGEDSEPLDAYAARLEAERKAHIARLETTIAEQSARIAELETWTVTQNYRRGIALDDIRCAILDTGHPIGDDSDTELTPLRLVREVLAKLAALEAESQVSAQVITALEAKATDPTPPRPVATWMGDVLLTPGGKVLGRVNVSRGTFGHMQAAPIYYPSEGEERLGPTGTIEAAREWVSDFARKIGWVVA